MPAARVQLRQGMPGQIATDALAVGGALQGGVVHQKHHAVGAELGVALEHAVAVRGTQPERRPGCFRGRVACAPVGDPARVGPSGEGGVQAGRCRGDAVVMRWPGFGVKPVQFVRAGGDAKGLASRGAAGGVQAQRQAFLPKRACTSARRPAVPRFPPAKASHWA
jgi:hypothetical protein